MPEFGHQRLEMRDLLQEALGGLLGAVAHDALDAGAVVPAAVEDQDLAGGGQLLDVALHVDLGLLPVGGRRQRDDAEDPRADPLGQPLDHAALAGGVAALEDDDDAGAGLLHPGLQVGDLDLQAGEFLLVGLVAGLLRLGRGGRCRRLRRLCLLVLLAHGVPPFGLIGFEGAQRVVEVVEDHVGADRIQQPGPVEQAAHVGVQFGETEGDAAAGKVGPHLLEHRGGGGVDLGDGAGVEHQPAGVRRQRIGDAMRRAWTWSALKNSRSPWISAMARPGIGRASGRRWSL